MGRGVRWLLARPRYSFPPCTEVTKRTQTIGAGHLGSVNAGLRPHARIHIRASVPVVDITEHGTRITLPNEC